ncbi:hypothetical protein PSHT_12784 [Puccinia striiformis]|uniref:Uncharacterized protein n=1 Tax=Puccinia striiformis TaxID=27350 RepID=A0A2S4UUG6_9BASI|nr:hypothetical protein PSHT_12784 [Puccinia striiformis]
MSSKGKHNSTASTYSSNKKRREHGLSPSSDGQPESVAQASPGEKSKKSSKSSKPPQEANSNDKEEDDDAPDKEEVFEVETIKSHLKKVISIPFQLSVQASLDLFPSTDSILT